MLNFHKTHIKIRITSSIARIDWKFKYNILQILCIHSLDYKNPLNFKSHKYVLKNFKSEKPCEKNINCKLSIDALDSKVDLI